MKSNRRSLLQCFLVAALGLLLTTAAADAQDYKIKLVRPEKAGNQYTTSVTASIKTEISFAGVPAVKQGAALELLGTVKVLEVSEKNSAAKKIECRVDHFTKDGTDLYPAGTVITGQIDGKLPKYMIDGKPVSAMNQQYLAAVLNLSDASEIANEDDVAGTDQPQKAGATWPMNNTKAAEAMSALGLPITADDLKGESKLVKIKKLNGTAVMQIDMTSGCDGLNKTMADGSTISDGVLHTDISQTLPVDDSQPLISRSSKVHLSMTVTPKNNAVKTTVKIDQDVKEQQSR